MIDCVVCRDKGAIYCNTRTLDNPNLTKEDLIEMLKDIRDTKEMGGKL